jgi:hypothetical protein
MRRVITTDRGEIVHLAGFRELSPAHDDAGAPAFSAKAGDGLVRCGWEPFFRTLRRRRLAIALDEDADAPRFTRDARRAAAAEGGLARAVAHSRRFWRALFPPASAPAPRA